MVNLARPLYTFTLVQEVVIVCFSFAAKPSVGEKSDTPDTSSAADKTWTDAAKDLGEGNQNESITQEDEDEDSTLTSER